MCHRWTKVNQADKNSAQDVHPGLRLGVGSSGGRMDQTSLVICYFLQQILFELEATVKYLYSSII